MKSSDSTEHPESLQKKIANLLNENNTADVPLGKDVGQGVVNVFKLQGARPAFTSVNKQIRTKKFKGL